jgi:HD-GYP domain-containing protein (c-di-GMP phosphodiesterase class II)
MATSAPGIELDPERQAGLARSRARLARALESREGRVESVASILFVAVALGMAVLLDHGGLSIWAAAGLVVAYVAALRVEFEVAGGYTVPTIAVLVPMLFLLPAGAVPLCVLVAVVLNQLINVLQRRRRLGRLLVAFGQGWYAVGPALVFAVAPPGRAGWEDAPLVLGAFAAYVVFDALSSLSVDHYGAGEPLRSLLADALWVYFVDLLLVPVGLVVAIAAQGQALAVFALGPLLFLLAFFATERRERIDHALALSQAYRGTALLLGDVVEADDQYTGTHSRDVVELALAVGTRLGLSPTQLRKVEFGALLHDVGKIAVPKEILHKAGPLDDAEWEIMRRHTVDGQRMLEGVGGLLAEVGFVVRCSHEHYDGSGYPDGIAGEAIPIEARICTTCDAYSAMTTDRVYRRAMPEQKAMAELRANAGRMFDPAVVDALLAELATVAELERPSTLAQGAHPANRSVS